MFNVISCAICIRLTYAVSGFVLRASSLRTSSRIPHYSGLSRFPGFNPACYALDVISRSAAFFGPCTIFPCPGLEESDLFPTNLIGINGLISGSRLIPIELVGNYNTMRHIVSSADIVLYTHPGVYSNHCTQLDCIKPILLALSGLEC